MGKKNKDKKKNKTIAPLLSNEEIRNLSVKEVDELAKQLEDVKRQYRAKCSHTKKNGEPIIQVIDADKQLVKCQKCGAVFSLRQINNKELRNAMTIMNDAVNQIKLLTNGEKSDNKTISDLGTIPENMDRAKTLYTRIIIEGGKGKKKKHKKNNNHSYGDYGYSNIK